MATQQKTLFDEPDALTPEARQEFDGRKMSRRTDPESSKRAAAEMAKTGRASEQRQHAIDLVFRFPGYTSKQLAAESDLLDRHQIARRLPEAKDAGDIHCKAEKGRELTWWPGGAE